jgi:hypothetical protein
MGRFNLETSCMSGTYFHSVCIWLCWGFTCTVSVTLPVAWGLCCQSALTFGWCQTGQHSTYSHTAEPAQLLWVLRVKGMLQHSMTIRSHLTPAVHCVSRVHLTTYHLSSWQITLLRSVFSHLMVTCTQKLTVLGDMLHHIFNLLYNKESHYGDLV